MPLIRRGRGALQGKGPLVDDFVTPRWTFREEKSKTHENVLIPGIENCRTCHSPATRTESGVKKGGVRQDCVTCHRYHHGDQPLAGRGSAARAAEARRGLEEFLSGKKKD